jgi:FAD synthetase
MNRTINYKLSTINSSRVMLFGVFDRLHPGHLYLLYHARQKGRELIVVVARDTAVKKLKGHAPKESEEVRVRHIRETKLATKVILGDTKQESYAVIKKYKPDAIALGYDQKGLAKDLKARIKTGDLPALRLISLKAYKPKEFHSSLSNHSSS